MLLANFKAPWWLKNSHLQTLYPTIFQKKIQLNLIYDEFELSDSDKIGIHWTSNKNENLPLIILLHGLEGSSSSHYIKRMMQDASQIGYRVVCVHFRGCGPVLTPKKSYHAGYTEDFEDFFSSLIKSKNFNQEIYVVGYSLGGNVLIKWLALSPLAQYITAAAAVSVPFDLLSSSQVINKGFAKIYQRFLLNALKKSMQIHFNIKVTEKTIYDFDDNITAKWSGFKNAKDYYSQSSSNQFLIKVTTPVLIIHAKDDPFLDPGAIPTWNQFSPSIKFELSDNGGHLGFVCGKNPLKPEYWLEKRILNYFSATQSAE